MYCNLIFHIVKIEPLSCGYRYIAELRKIFVMISLFLFSIIYYLIVPHKSQQLMSER